MASDMIDETHDPDTHSWVESAQGHSDFPIQNLPLGVFRRGSEGARGGIAIGDQILDIGAAASAGLFEGDALVAAQAASGATLNALMAMGGSVRQALRRRVSAMLDAKADRSIRQRAAEALVDAASCRLELPAAIGDYTDFYAGIHHAETVGKLYRPDNPLLPNYKYVPIGYHGRASSVRASGADVRRPKGQRKAPNAEAPSFGACARLDYELELGLWVGPGNGLGDAVPIAEAGRHLVGISLLNDWSARDIQTWEYQPLGPFLAKSFMTTVSPWIVTAEALAPFRAAQPARPAGDPQPLDYLWDADDQAAGALGIDLAVAISTATMRAEGVAACELSRSSALDLYWTVAQLIAHHTSNGCDLRPGDLLGTGTISGPASTQAGSLLELGKGGTAPVAVGAGERRTFLEDGDEIVFSGRCRREGYATIGFGPCVGRIIPAN